jgi:hypothetical protein
VNIDDIHKIPFLAIGPGGHYVPVTECAKLFARLEFVYRLQRLPDCFDPLKNKTGFFTCSHKVMNAESAMRIHHAAIEIKMKKKLLVRSGFRFIA